jgi:hypothetical protein
VNHADVRNYMADYLEGDLVLSRRALLDAHLDDCPECSQEIDEMRGTIALLRGLPDPDVPPDLANQVMRRIRSGEGQLTLLDRVRAGIDLLLSPRVLAPISAAAIATGLLMATGQIPTLTGAGSIFERGVRVELNSGEGATARRADAAQQQLANAGASAGSSGAVRESVPQAIVIFSDRNQPSSAWDVAGPITGIDQMLDARSSSGPLVMRPAPTTPVGGRDPRLAGLPSTQGFNSASLHSPDRGVPYSRELPSPDEWLEYLERNPSGFASWLSTLSLAEQELWVGNLARRAADHGNLDAVVTTLRSSSDRNVQLLADDFAAARGDASGGVD